MNEIVRSPRRKWRTAELERMERLGLFRHDERFELIEGEIVPMSPKGRRHELVTDELHVRLVKRTGDDLWVSAERQFNLSEHTYTDPDLVVRPMSIKAFDLAGPTALLVIEVADSSLAYDLGEKAQTYARHGVREYWVVNAWELETTIHRDPTGDGYGAVEKRGRTERLVPLLVPQLAIRLEELGLD